MNYFQKNNHLYIKLFISPLLLLCSLNFSCKKNSITQKSDQINSLSTQTFHLSSTYVYKNVRIGGGGYVTGIVFNAAAANVIYARTDQGGAYRWDNTAGKWVQMLLFLGHDDFELSNVETIAADPSDATRVYIGCGQDLYAGAQSAIFRSTDKGVTLEKIVPPFQMGGNYSGRGNGERLQVDPNKGSILLMGTRVSGLYKSLDYGSTWAQVSSFPVTSTTNQVGINCVIFDKRSAATGNATQTIYASVSKTGNNIYQSTNGGATWTALPGQPNNNLMPHRMKLGSNGVLYVTFSDTEGPGGESTGAVWKYDTGTRAWTNITPAGYNNGFGGICPDNQNPAVLMLTTTGLYPDVILRSINGGTSWKNVGQNGTNNVSRNVSVSPWVAFHDPSPGAGHWVDDIEIDPFNSAKVMYIDGGGMWASANINNSDTNGSVVWYPNNNDIEQMGGWGSGKNLVSPPTGNAHLFTTFGDIGGFKHYNLDVSPPDSNFYNPIGNSNTSIDIAWKKPGTIVRTNYENTRGSYTINGGTTWTDFSTCPAAAISNPENDPGYISVSALGNDIVWNPRGSGLYYSTNKGASWQACTGTPTATASWNRFVPVADKVNDQKFYIQDPRSGDIYRSVNGGVGFTKITTLAAPSDPGGWAMQAVPGNEGHIFAPQGTTGLYHTTDGGSTWTKITSVQACEQVGYGKSATTNGTPLFIFMPV